MPHNTIIQADGIDLLTHQPHTAIFTIINGKSTPLQYHTPESSKIKEYRSTPSKPENLTDTIIDNYQFENLAKTVGAHSYHNQKNHYDFTRLKTLKIADLGCGTDDTPDSENISYKPELCRLLHKYGIDVTGVDAHYPKYENRLGVTEDWKFVRMQIVRGNPIECFKNNELDVIWSNMFIGDGNSCSISPSMAFSLGSHEYNQLEKHIFTEALRILKPGGLFIVNYNGVYQKKLNGIKSHFDVISGKSDRSRIVYMDHSLILE